MMEKLWLYFGAVGSISILGWAAAWLIFAGFARSRRRTLFYWMALLAAGLALVLAKINSHLVSAIEVDRSAEHAQALERQQQLRQQQEQDLKKKAANVRFAEDTPADALDLAGVSTPVSDKYEQAAAEDETRYAYRQRGKQQRAANALTATNAVAPAANIRPARQLPERDVVQANRLDRLNLWCVQFTFALAWFLVGWDYLSRFNRTFGHLYPLPIAHPALDSVWPKQHTVLMPTAAPATITAYLKNVVRKGENFIYLGENDPLSETQSLPKLAACWSLRKITIGAGHKAYDNEFVFESAWFHRYAFVIAGTPEVERRLAGLKEFLHQRQRTQARTRQTVHVVWNYPATPPPDLAAVADHCRATNFKLIVIGAAVTDIPFEETGGPLRS